MAPSAFTVVSSPQSILSVQAIMIGRVSQVIRSQWFGTRRLHTRPTPRQFVARPDFPSVTHTTKPLGSRYASQKAVESAGTSDSSTSVKPSAKRVASLPPDWEDTSGDINEFSQLPHKDFGLNQLIQTNEDFKRALRMILRHFPPLSHSFAYGSGVFPQSDATASPTSLSPHPNPPEAILKWQKGGGKIIDFIFATKFSPHFHSLNLRRHPDHYSFLRYFGSDLISRVQDGFGAGAYFNPYINVDGTLIKYGVVNIETLRRDLLDWDTLFLAGRLQKPVKILIEDPTIVYANQRNLMAAVRCTLLLMGPSFTETEFYATLAALSYRGDPRISFGSEHPSKIQNIVTHQLTNFRQLYTPLIETLPNMTYNDSRQKQADWQNDVSLDLRMEQDMDPQRRATAVRRLPKSFREKLYFLYQNKFQIPGGEFKRMLAEAKDEDELGGVRRPIATPFDLRIANESDLGEMVGRAVKKTVQWPSTMQTIKGILSAGPTRGWKYVSEKRAKGRAKKD